MRWSEADSASVSRAGCCQRGREGLLGCGEDWWAPVVPGPPTSHAISGAFLHGLPAGRVNHTLPPRAVSRIRRQYGACMEHSAPGAWAHRATKRHRDFTTEPRFTSLQTADKPGQARPTCCAGRGCAHGLPTRPASSATLAPCTHSEHPSTLTFTILSPPPLLEPPPIRLSPKIPAR